MTKIMVILQREAVAKKCEVRYICYIMFLKTGLYARG